jgi:RNA polymerase-associated protein
VEINNKRSVMTVYSDKLGIESHQVRIVLAEKATTVDVIEIDAQNKPEDLLELNPYGSLPTLMDRDLVLYNANIIMEYLDERFPHPPLLPVYPVARAQSRLLRYRIHHDWYTLAAIIENGTGDVEKARQELRDGLVAIADAFDSMPFFMSDEFSLVDCALMPLLWRLSHYKVELPRSAKAIENYSQRLFERNCFQVSLTDAERELRR